MNFYILPKNNNIFKIIPILKIDKIETYTTHSLLIFYKDILEQIEKIKKNDKDYPSEIVDNLFKTISPYEYIFSIIPGTQITISKLKVSSNTFYDFYEIANTINFIDTFSKNINALYISENCNDLVYCHELLRKNENDFTISCENIDNVKDINVDLFNIIFYEIKNEDFNNINNYVIQLLKILNIILSKQINNGNCIIKISNIFYKPIIDILYIFSSMYDKVYIIKPNTSNVNSFDKYIVCNNFILNDNTKNTYQYYYSQIELFLSSYVNNVNVNNIFSILSIEIPAYFLNKIDDINIIFGQQQLETIDQIINILKNKNREEKIDFYKKTNIQKSISWCEKYKIPHNKLSDKPNIFLPLRQYNEVYNDDESAVNLEEEFVVNLEEESVVNLEKEIKLILDNNI
jgi:hypothetical protein